MKMKSIMIVDDDETHHYVTEAMINDFVRCITITKAYDGLEALELLKYMEEPPSLILLDINMPRMNGLEFLESLKTLDVPSAIFMLSSSDLPRDRKAALSYNNVKDYIVKPLNKNNLASIFR